MKFHVRFYSSICRGKRVGITEGEEVCLWVVIKDSLLIYRLGVPLILMKLSSYIFGQHLFLILGSNQALIIE